MEEKPQAGFLVLEYGLEWPITDYYYLIMRTYSTNDIISLENALHSDSTSPIVFRDAIVAKMSHFETPRTPTSTAIVKCALRDRPFHPKVSSDAEYVGFINETERIKGVDAVRILL